MPPGTTHPADAGSPPAVTAGVLDHCFEPLAALIRGTAVESVHRGALAVVDQSGALLGSVGDPFAEVLLRSSAKPFQAAAVLESGAAETFSMSEEEIAVVAASHTGSEQHERVVAGLLQRAALPDSLLVCGALGHMCSGKHTGMLLVARQLGVAPEGYQYEAHPVQQRISDYLFGLLRRCPALPPSARRRTSLFAGVDGCGVPVVRVSLFEAAWLYAALAAGITPELARVRDGMVAHPGLVAGDERFDTRLMRAARGGAIAKGGAEGVEGVALVPVDGGRGLGLALKIEDGSARPIPALAAKFLRAWERTEAAAALEHDYPSGLRGAGGVEVGRLEVVVEARSLRRESGRFPRLGVDQGVPSGMAPACAPLDPEPHGGAGVFSKKGDHLTVCRGDEKDVVRFLREQWPRVDEEMFGRAVEWTALPYALVYRRDRRIVGVLRGHFIGGIASVDELMVARGFRGCGMGSMLLGRFEDEARKRGSSRVILRAVKESAAEDFYRQRGYHRECVQYRYEFGYDYVRLVCDVEKAPGQAGRPTAEGKGA